MHADGVKRLPLARADFTKQTNTIGTTARVYKLQ
jgi:hypothetical protein